MAPAYHYNKDELLKLRDSVKESAEIVRKINESGSGVKEHLLRSSSKSMESFPKRGHRARSSSIITNPYEEPPNDDYYFRNKARNRSGRQSKYSPTPSIKRGKAEKLLKEHGSPPGIRVTAGGRIVPDGLTPLTSPRFDLNNSLGWPRFHNNISGFRSYPYKAHSSSNLKDMEGFIVNMDGTGNPGQVVGGDIRPIEQHNGMYQLVLPPNNVQQYPAIPPFGQLTGQSAFSTFQPLPMIGLSQNQGFGSAGIALAQQHSEIPTLKQVKAMEQYYSKLEADMKELDRNEVLRRKQLTSSGYSEIVQTRVKLTNRLDQLRKAIQEAKRAAEEKRQNQGSEQSAPSNTIEPVHSIVPSFLPCYAGQAIEPFHPQQLESKSCAGPDYTTIHPICGSEVAPERFQPPHAVSNPFCQAGSMPIALQERAGNVALGVASDSYNNGGSLKTLKSREGNGNSGSRSMNLDGSAHQPRRSHAIAIKDPRDQVSKNSSSLNPASPSYEPYKPQTIKSQPSTTQSDTSHFVPSPKLVAEMDHLVQSPGKHNTHCEVSTVEFGQMHPSDSSASTEDFFPHNTHHHSATKYSYSKRDSKINLPAWMPRDGEARTQTDEHSGKPSRPPNKFIWNDSPNDKFYLNSHDDSDTHLAMHSVVAYQPAGKENSSSMNEGVRYLDIVSQSTFSTTTPKPETNRRSHVRESTVTGDVDKSIADDKSPISHLLAQASERAASLSGTTPEKSLAYLDGYKLGLRQEVLEPNPDKEYRLGYRDGLLQSYLVAPTSETKKDSSSQETGQQSLTPQKKHLQRSLSALKAPSCPSLFQPTKVPVNSLNTTPKTCENTCHAVSPATPQPLESPKTAADFMSKPNVNLSNSCNSGIEKFKRAPEPVSPSPNRRSKLRANDGNNQASLSFATRMSPCGNYDRQRYQKSGTSTAQTGSHAQGWIPSQLDGSSDGENAEGITPAPGSPEFHSSPTTPSKGNKVGEKMMSKSPVKAKASAAMVKMGQLAGGLGSGTKKERKVPSPKDMPSPEKDRWRSKWRVRFEKLRESEQREGADIRAHPITELAKGEQISDIKIHKDPASKPH